MSKRRLVLAAVVSLLAFIGAIAVIGFQRGAEAVAGPIEVVMYKSPWCGCCGSWADHMNANGFKVVTHEVEDLTPIKEKAGITDELMSCHTAFVGGYAIEGHVPASAVARLLAEKPAARGLSVPGMPNGAPGMENGQVDPYDVVLIGRNGRHTIFESHR